MIFELVSSHSFSIIVHIIIIYFYGKDNNGMRDKEHKKKEKQFKQVYFLPSFPCCF